MARRITQATSQSFSLGNGAIGDKLAGFGIISVSFWITPQGFSTAGAGDNVIFVLMVDGTNHGMKINFNATAGNLLRVGARSISTDAFQSQVTTTAFVAGTRYHVGVVYDFAGDNLKCVIDGVQDFSSAVTFGSTSYANGSPTIPDQIAINTGVAFQVDGEVSELTFHSGEIVTSEFLAMSKGKAARSIQKHRLLAHIPFREESGNVLEEINGIVGTQVGTVVYADHPPVNYSSPKQRAFAAAAPVVAVASIDTLGTITPGATGVAFTYSDMTGTPTGMTLGDGTNSFSVTNFSATGSGSGSGTFDCPSILSIGSMLTSGTYTITATLTDGTDSPTTTATFNAQSGYDLITPTGSWLTTDAASLAFDWGSNVLVADQILSPTEFTVDPLDGHWSTSETTGTWTFYAIDFTIFSVESFTVILSVAASGDITVEAVPLAANAFNTIDLVAVTL